MLSSSAATSEHDERELAALATAERKRTLASW
jgi:hypothetical protein